MGAALLVLSGYYGTNKAVSVTLIALEFAVSSVVFSAGFVPNIIDLSPNYAGILMGIVNTIATLPGMIGPVVAGAIVQEVSWREKK